MSQRERKSKPMIYNIPSKMLTMYYNAMGEHAKTKLEEWKDQNLVNIMEIVAQQLENAYEIILNKAFLGSNKTSVVKIIKNSWKTLIKREFEKQLEGTNIPFPDIEEDTFRAIFNKLYENVKIVAPYDTDAVIIRNKLIVITAKIIINASIQFFSVENLLSYVY